MATHFYASIRDEITGALLIEELECEIEHSVSVVSGELKIEILDIKVDGQSLWAGTDLSKAIASQVSDQIDRDLREGGKLYHALIEENDIAYRGRGGNDPDAHYAYAS